MPNPMLRHWGQPLSFTAAIGFFAVVAGTLYQDKAKANLTALKELHIIPQDSFLSRGEGLDGLVWMSYQKGASFDFATQPNYLRVVERLQAAMSKLGLYSGTIDGLIGPTTVKAFRAYLARFDLQPDELLTDYSLAEIERNAGDGFRSDEERNAARALGYTDAQSLNDARSGGFTSAILHASAHGRSAICESRLSRGWWMRARMSGSDAHS